MSSFICGECGKETELPIGNGAAGYGVPAAEPDVKICYACCGRLDELDMLASGRATLYLTTEKTANGSTVNYVTNWPGTLKMRAYHVRSSKRGGGFGSQRTDFWFRHMGDLWHGVNRGYMQLARCRRLKFAGG